LHENEKKLSTFLFVEKKIRKYFVMKKLLHIFAAKFENNEKKN